MKAYTSDGTYETYKTLFNFVLPNAILKVINKNKDFKYLLISINPKTTKWKNIEYNPTTVKPITDEKTIELLDKYEKPHFNKLYDEKQIEYYNY